MMSKSSWLPVLGLLILSCQFAYLIISNDIHIDPLNEKYSRHHQELAVRVVNFSSLEPLEMPTPMTPFVFFHLRKTGGSSIRDMLYNASHQMKLTSFLPCYLAMAMCHVKHISSHLMKRYSAFTGATSSMMM